MYLQIPQLLQFSRYSRATQILLGCLLAIIVLAVPLVVVSGFYGYLAFDAAVSGPRAAEMEARLEKEFGSIITMPEAKKKSDNSVYKTHHGARGAYYKTHAPWNQIKAFYDAELAKHGWRFVGDEKAIYNLHDYGGTQAFYCKGDLVVDVFYAGEQQAQFGWTYALNVSWGTYHKCK